MLHFFSIILTSYQLQTSCALRILLTVLELEKETFPYAIYYYILYVKKKSFNYTFKFARSFTFTKIYERYCRRLEKIRIFLPRTQMARVKLIMAAMRSRAVELSSLYNFLHEIQIDPASVIFLR